ncbi:toxin secretion/phage lysis holin [Bacillus mesophilus]|uniref:Phage holin family protein n=1 Tax=Bacillus mesophilus TaxID=1808955 RepID=A0A6M0Q6N0_9BACI|nr:phage holin family protein [Bacillus mesophilus]MBM7660446.1 toxin secretion/phage lysis holin [Bacillus mesophilus]NEY72002.1 phage holin family protein [Bacillus mesophilus]
MKVDFSIATILSLAGSLTSYMFGGWGSLLTILTFMVIVDYLTGIIAAGIEKKLCSKIGFRGIAQKLLIFVLVSVAHMIDMITEVEYLVRDATIIFYIMNEIISILENAKRVGLPIPVFLIKVIELVKSKSKKK